MIVGSALRIQDETPEFYKVLSKDLTIRNPDFTMKERMGFYTGNIPKNICLFSLDGEDIIVPYGCLYKIKEMCPDVEIIDQLPKNPPTVDYKSTIKLYDYQRVAVQEMLKTNVGILKAPTGSGKTQMGLAIAAALGRRTLWLTHTLDLVNQSMKRAQTYFDNDLIGTIKEGKVEIGKGITFATVQTVAAMDLSQVKNTWDVVIVDECHRVAGTPSRMTRFSKVLNSLSAHYKFGLSATVHRADGMIAATYAIMGAIVYSVPEDAAAGKIMPVQIAPIALDVPESDSYRDSSGELHWHTYISWMVHNQSRNEQMLKYILKNRRHPALILSCRVEHLGMLMDMLPEDMREKSVRISSLNRKATRDQAIADMVSGKKKYMFATYALAKEGLDIPRLERLFMVTPESDYAIVVQSVGRIARACDGKKQPIAYDFVNNYEYEINRFKRRCRHYRRHKYELITV